MNILPPEVELQREYYARTAGDYDQMHLDRKSPHYLSLSFLVGALDYLEAESVLDVGSGTGRAIQHIKERKPGIRAVGIEPVKSLRDVGYRKGLEIDELIDGDATRLPFPDGAFDVTCEFGVLHHLKEARAAVLEMLRVARKAVFISDSNNFGQGHPASRLTKRLLNSIGLWKLADYLKTRGKGYIVSEGDGVVYSYSVFKDYELIRARCRQVHLIGTQADGINPYRSAGTVVLFGVK